jgi:hypothetical protein
MRRRGTPRQPPSARAEAARRRALPGRFGAEMSAIDGQAVAAAATAAGMPGHAAAFRAGAAKLVMVEDLDPALAAAPEAPAPSTAGAPSVVDRMLDGAVVAVDATVLANLHARAAVGDNVEADRAREARRTKVSAAVSAGKIPPWRRQHFEALMVSDPEGTEQVLDALPANTIPLAELGHSVEADGSGATVVVAGYGSTVGLPASASLLTPAERATLDARRGRA